MATTYRNLDWSFDSHRWANDLNRVSDKDKIAALELSGLTASAWWGWLNPRPGKPYQYPQMTNFLNICNLLNLDPRDYFSLALPEHDNE